MLRNGAQTGKTRWKSPEMDELDLVLSQDIRKINWGCVVFEFDEFDEGSFSTENPDSDGKSRKKQAFLFKTIWKITDLRFSRNKVV